MTHVAASALGRGAPAAAAAPVPLLGMVTDEAGAVGGRRAHRRKRPPTASPTAVDVTLWLLRRPVLVSPVESDMEDGA